MQLNRRELLKGLATSAGALILLPKLSLAAPNSQPDLSPIKAPPMSWNPIVYNKERGAAGAIPAAYMAKINAPDGIKKHLGKHLPYRLMEEAPEGYLAIMWGDPKKGHARHPNASKSPKKPEGHWYNWIRLRKACEGPAEEQESRYADWPGDQAAGYLVQGDGEIKADGGRNTIYLAKLPAGLKKGDRIRIWAHCLSHGEYVDFLEI